MLSVCDWYGKVKQKGSSWQSDKAGARAGAAAVRCRLCSGRWTEWRVKATRSTGWAMANMKSHGRWARFELFSCGVF
jgi:hypothetical protein